MPVYSLGAHAFINANRDDIRGGLPPLPKEWVEVIPAAPGIDGEAIRNNGIRSEPFAYRTCAYLSSSALALARFELYHQTVGQVPQNLVWEGVDYDTSGVRFSVLDVRDCDIRFASSTIVDGVVLGNVYLLYATWILLPVEF
jgi:hypothetical protein